MKNTTLPLKLIHGDHRHAFIKTTMATMVALAINSSAVHANEISGNPNALTISSCSDLPVVNPIETEVDIEVNGTCFLSGNQIFSIGLPATLAATVVNGSPNDSPNDAPNDAPAVTEIVNFDDDVTRTLNISFNTTLTVGADSHVNWSSDGSDSDGNLAILIGEDQDGSIINNQGGIEGSGTLISIKGDNTVLNNTGEIQGEGDFLFLAAQAESLNATQNNDSIVVPSSGQGVVFVDSSADNVTINNGLFFDSVPTFQDANQGIAFGFINEPLISASRFSGEETAIGIELNSDTDSENTLIQNVGRITGSKAINIFGDPEASGELGEFEGTIDNFGSITSLASFDDSFSTFSVAPLTSNEVIVTPSPQISSAINIEDVLFSGQINNQGAIIAESNFGLIARAVSSDVVFTDEAVNNAAINFEALDSDIVLASGEGGSINNSAVIDAFGQNASAIRYNASGITINNGSDFDELIFDERVLELDGVVFEEQSEIVLLPGLNSELERDFFFRQSSISGSTYGIELGSDSQNATINNNQLGVIEGGTAAISANGSNHIINNQGDIFNDGFNDFVVAAPTAIIDVEFDAFDPSLYSDVIELKQFSAIELGSDSDNITVNNSLFGTVFSDGFGIDVRGSNHTINNGTEIPDLLEGLEDSFDSSIEDEVGGLGLLFEAVPSIAGDEAGINLNDDSSDVIVNNLEAGIIGGTDIGIQISGAGHTINNDGIIIGLDLDDSIFGIDIGFDQGPVFATGISGEDDFFNLNEQLSPVPILSETGITLAASSSGVTINNEESGIIFGEEAGLKVEGSGHTIRNSGLIAGLQYSVFAGDSSETITFEQFGAPSLLDGEIEISSGFLIGDFIGSSAGFDSFNLSGGSFALINNFSNSVNVNVSAGAQLIVNASANDFVSDELFEELIGTDSSTFFNELGITEFIQQSRFIDGDLNSDGDLFFVLGLPALDVDGDVNLNSGSTITVNQNNLVSEIGQQFTLIEVGGVLTNEATISSINEPLPVDINDDFPNDSGVIFGELVDDSFSDVAIDSFEIEDQSALLDLVAVENEDGNLVVEAVEAFGLFDDLATTPEAPVDNFMAFSEDIIDAFNNDELDEETFQSLTGIETVEEVAQAIATFQPDTTNSNGQQLFEAIQSIGSLINQRINSVARNAGTSNSNTAFNGNFQAVPAVFNADDTSAQSVEVQNAQSRANTDLALNSGVWVQLSYNDADQDNNSNPSSLDNGYQADSTSIAFGYDVALDETTLVGLSLSYSDLDIRLDRISQDQTEIDAYQVTAYAWRKYGALQVSGQIGFSDADADSQRQTITGGVTSSSDLDGFNASIQASYTYSLTDTAYISPLVGLGYADISQDGFTESGSLGLTVGEIDNDYFEGRLGFTIGNQVVKTSSATDAFLTAVLVDDFGSGPDDVTVSFGNQTSSLSVFNSDDTRLELTLGMNWYSSNNWSFGAALDAEYGDDFSSYGGNLRVKYNF